MKSRTRSKARAASAAEPDTPEDHLGYLLKRLQHSIRQAIDEALRHADVGLSFAHLATLMALTHHPGISGARLAKGGMITAQTANALLHRLEAEGSVERRPDPHNRRADRWYITDAGRVQMQKARAVCDPVWSAMLEPLEESEVAQLRELLKRCIGGLERDRAGSCTDPCLHSFATSRLSRPSPADAKKQTHHKENNR